MWLSLVSSKFWHNKQIKLRSVTHFLNFLPFLAHLSQRLIGELIVYSCSSVRPWPSSVVVVHNIKHLLRNHSPNQSQILCGDSLGRGNESLFAASGSHDQDGRHAHICFFSLLYSLFFFKILLKMYFDIQAGSHDCFTIMYVIFIFSSSYCHYM